ncbi:MAG: ATP-binding protein [Helicobacteraceae bacterium]|jgi:4-hydroxy-tetrahydrodipicolinate synthase|nr:ATP-binding protein [Helicobacteraceae bacterium]
MNDEKVFAKAKTLFEDSESNSYYVLLSRTNLAYSRIENAFNNPFKILLLTGAPGTGKSYVLRRFYQDHAEHYTMFLYPSATFGVERLVEIYEKLYGEKLVIKDLETILSTFKAKEPSSIYILLDEAQLYNEEQMEWIRVLSNGGTFRFVIVVHRVGEEDILAKAHFKTRTFEVVDFKAIDQDEVRRFIETKLMLGEMPEHYDRFKKKALERIYQFTQGNLRDLNRLMHRIFDLLNYIESQKPHKLPVWYKPRLVEMAALELGMVNG